MMLKVAVLACIGAMCAEALMAPPSGVRARGRRVLFESEKSEEKEVAVASEEEAEPVTISLDENPEQPDIIKKFVKQRDDWWGEDNSLASGSGEEGIFANIAKAPVPSYAYLLGSTVLAIAFVGCIFQLGYNEPPAPVLGVPLTIGVLVTSGPAFLFLFLVAIARGQRETFEDDNRYNM